MKKTRLYTYAAVALISTCLFSSCGSEPDEISVAGNETTQSSREEENETVQSSHEESETSQSFHEEESTSVQSSPAGAENESLQSSGIAPLHVSGTHLEDDNGNAVQLYGMSTHNLAWYPQFVEAETFQTLKEDWNTNCIRLAMYTYESGGYCSDGNRENLKRLVRDGIDYAAQLDMYVIIDWHVLNDRDPNVYVEDAKDFFAEMSADYKEYDNVIYEICNEPNGATTWDDIKKYADAVIPVIRENAPDSVILVGTPFWCQEIDKAAADPLPYENIMYTFHFYAATHQDDLRNRLETCLKSDLPVFVSEFGTCDASGNGGNDFTSSTKWLELLDRYEISYCCWNLANKAESSSVIQSSCDKLSNWTEDDLSESGNWIRNYFRGK